MKDFFKYLELVNAYRGDRDPIGFTCEVSEDDAIGWIGEHRPWLYEEYFGENATSPW